MEKTKSLMVVPSNFSWRDVGNWNSLSKCYAPDNNGNKVNGKAVLKDKKNCYIENKGKNIAVIGANNLAIINSGDSILIADKSRTSEVKKLFFEEQNEISHQFPWGKQKSLGKMAGRISLKSLSIQRRLLK